MTQEEHTLWKLLEQSSRAQNVRELLETGALPRSVVDSWVNLGEITQIDPAVHYAPGQG